MKELLQQSAAYNVWANQQLIEAVLRLPEELQTKEISSSFPGLHRTILHMWDAGSIWWQRLKLQEVVIPPSQHFNGITRDAANGLMHQDKLWEGWVNNASDAARYLEGHANISEVNYTGLASHPHHHISAKQMRHPGPMMSIELKGGLEAGKKFIDRLKMCTRAVSLGTTDTLISHPASMSHFGLSREERAKFGITDGLIRMSIGIENLKDILNDLEQALS